LLSAEALQAVLRTFARVQGLSEAAMEILTWKRRSVAGLYLLRALRILIELTVENVLWEPI